MQGDNTQRHITRFLRDYPNGRLYVAVGYASVWGLAWLHENTRERSVTLIIGHTQDSRFQTATDSDRRKALALLQRRDVRVLNWYRTARSAKGASALHAKSWIVADRNAKGATAALVGSANLTRDGLENNWEIMTIAAEDELPRIWRQVEGFLQGRTVNNKPWDVASKLIEAIQTGKDAQQRRKTGPTKQQRPSDARKRGGCLVLAAAMGGMLTAIAATVLLLFL